MSPIQPPGGPPPPVAAPGSIYPLINYRTTDVTPGSPIYVQNEDSLVFGATGDVSVGAPLRITYRLLRPDGTIINANSTADLGLAGNMTLTSIRLTEGFLLSCGVGQLVALGSPGRTYCTMGLVRGDPNQQPFSAVLFSGYLTAHRSLGWPGGPTEAEGSGQGFLRTIVGTDPAAGVEVSEVVPGGVRWRLISLVAALVTDATVINRFVGLWLDDGASVYFKSTGPSHPASNTIPYTFSTAAIKDPGVLSGGTLMPIPIGIVLPAGHRMRTNTLNLQAGDNYGAPIFLVEQWTALN